MPRPSSTPEELLAELAPLSQDEQARWVMTYSRFANPHFVRELVEMSDAIRYENTARMLQLADLARLAADACTVAIVGSALELADLRALGWRQYGNALRISGRLDEAEEAFANAQRFCKEGTGDPPLRAALLARMSSLRYFQRRFDEAISLADEAARIYSELGESCPAGKALIQKAIAQIYMGEADAAVPTLSRAIPLIDPQGDPALLLAACHNLIRCYTEVGEPEQALSLSFEARSLYRDFQDPLIALRAGWQEGQLLRDLGHLRAAEAALLQAHHGFLERGLFYEVALVSLDLSAVFLRLGEIEKLHEAVAEMVPIFKSLGADREVSSALLQLQQADQLSLQAPELIPSLTSRLEERRIAALLIELIERSGMVLGAIEESLGWEPGLQALLEGPEGVSFEILLKVLPALDEPPGDFFARLCGFDPERQEGSGSRPSSRSDARFEESRQVVKAAIAARRSTCEQAAD